MEINIRSSQKCLLDLQKDSPVVCIDCRAADRLYAHAVQKRARQQAARQAQEQDTSNLRSPSPRSHAFKRHAPDFFQRQQVLTLLADTTQFPQFSILCMSECSTTSLHTSSKPYVCFPVNAWQYIRPSLQSSLELGCLVTRSPEACVVQMIAGLAGKTSISG